MGCDIHAMMEYVQPEYKSYWINAGDPDVHRNYQLFWVLAGVRWGHGDPIAKARGIAEDACPEFEAYAKSWKPDAHSHSYVTLDELVEYDYAGNTADSPTGWNRLQEKMRTVASQYNVPDHHVRLSFFFDN